MTSTGSLTGQRDTAAWAKYRAWIASKTITSATCCGEAYRSGAICVNCPGVGTKPVPTASSNTQ